MSEPSEGPAHPAPSARRWVNLGVLCLALLVVTLDNTILNVVLPALVRQLHATTSQLQWVTDAYVLVFAGLLLVAGSLADRFGRKRTFLAGLVFFLAGSTWAALAGSIGALIAARASMGIGAALISPSTLSIIGNMFPDSRERHRAFGIWAATSGVGLALGPIVGGLLLAHFWWGSVFLVNVPIVVLALLLSVPLLPDSKDPVARPPDLVGSGLSIAGLTMTLWAVIEAPGRGWTSAPVLGVGAGGLAVLGGFVYWEHVATRPMLTLGYFRNSRFSAGIAALAFVMLGGSGALFVLTQYLQLYRGYSALAAGVRVLPAAGAIVVVAPLVAPVVRRVGPKIPLAVGLAAVTAGLWQLAGIGAGTSYPAQLPYFAMLGVGMGLVMPTATSAIMDTLPPARAGVGSATNSTFMQFGTALGVAIMGSLLSSRYVNRLDLRPYHLPPAVRDQAQGSLGGAAALAPHLGPVGGALLTAARAAFLSGFGLSLKAGAGVVLAAVLVVLVAFSSRNAKRRPAQPTPATGSPAAGSQAAGSPAAGSPAASSPAAPAGPAAAGPQPGESASL